MCLMFCEYKDKAICPPFFPLEGLQAKQKAVVGRKVSCYNSSVR